ncbi:MAG: hypothetical protein Q9191_007003 [Dirinaria sp. TL-2023a]
MSAHCAIVSGNLKIMDLEQSPSKRARIEEAEPYAQQLSEKISNPATPLDELDDLYEISPSNTPPLTHSPDVPIFANTEQEKASEPQGVKQQFQLPGLGASIVSHSHDPANSLEVDTAPTHSSQNVLETYADETRSNEGDLTHSSPEQKEADCAVKDNQQIGSQVAQKVGNNEQSEATEPSKTEHIEALEAGPVTVSEKVSSNTPRPFLKELNVGLEGETRSSAANNGHTNVASLSPQLSQGAAAENEPQIQGLPNQQNPGVGEVEDSASKYANVAREGQTASQEQDKEVKRDECYRAEEGGVQIQTEEVAEGNKADESAEFEIDSSPYLSSSTDISSSTTSSEDSDDDYTMLDPEEQARRLMQEDAGSDDEGASKTGMGAPSGAPRTQNEKPDEIVPKINVVVTPDMSIKELGSIEALVENVALINTNVSGEYQVLETGSVLCLRDRSPIGSIAETLGRVDQPYYTVHFENPTAMAEACISRGTPIFYIEQLSTTVFTQPLRGCKGSDASNIHDEEVGDDEMEFSDDEKEAEYKRRIKQAKRQWQEGSTGATEGFSRAPGRGRNRNRGRCAPRGDRPAPGPLRYGGTVQINYDDHDNDGPYNTLARPDNLHEMMGRSEAPIETRTNSFDGYRGNPGRRGSANRGRGRGRGDRPRSHQDRRDNFQGHDNYGSVNSHYPVPDEDRQFATQSSYSFQSDTVPPSQYSYLNPFATNTQVQPSSTLFNYENHQQHGPPESHINFPNQAPLPNLPPGAFLNPAFFAQYSQGTQFSPPGSSTK